MRVLSCVQICNPKDHALQASLSMGFPKQEYWNGLPFPPPGDLPDPGIKFKSPKSLALAGGFFTTEPPEKDRQIIRGREFQTEGIAGAKILR